MPWPLERLVRQYVGFHALVIREYGDLIEYDDQCLVAKKSNGKRIIAHWRDKYPLTYPYIYHFRYIFDKYSTYFSVISSVNELISLPPKHYKDIVKCVK